MPETPWIGKRQLSRTASRPISAARYEIERLEGRTLLSVVTPVGPNGPGGPTMGFGANGLVSHPEPGFTSTSGVALQGDKTIIIGPYGPVGSREFGVTRFNADGSYDTTFGNDGVVYTSFGGDDVPTAIQVLPNGYVLVVGTDTTAGGSQFALAQYNNSGQLDPGFGNGTGKVLTSFSEVPGTLSHDVVSDVLAGPGGTLYVAGSSDAAGRQRDFAIAEYAPDGTLTQAFDGSGKLLIDFAGGDDTVSAITIMSDHGIVLAGSTTPVGSDKSEVVLARLIPNGGLNPQFGDNGEVVTSVGSVDDAASSVVGDYDNRILVAGHTGTGSAAAGTLSSDFLLLRYNADGTLDKTFGQNGAVATSFNQPAAASRVLALPNDDIVVSGKTTADLAALSDDDVDLDLGIAQYLSTGQLDTTFETTGAVIVHLSTGITDPVVGVGAARRRIATPSLASASATETTAELEQGFQVLIDSTEGTVVADGGDLFAVGTSTDGTIEATISTTATTTTTTSGVDLSIALGVKLPTSVISGTTGPLSVTITEAGTDLASGTATIDFYISATSTLQSDQDPSQTLSSAVKLKTGNATTIKVKKFDYSTSQGDGDYYVLATVSLANVTDINTSNNTAVSAATVHIAEPFIDLTGASFAVPEFKTGKKSTVILTLTNNGNETASGTPAMQLLASTDGTLANATAIATFPTKLKLKAGASAKVKETLSLPTTLPSGTYVLLARIDIDDIFNDTDLTNNLLTSSNSFSVVAL